MQQQQTVSQSDCDMQWKVDFMWQPALPAQWSLNLRDEAPKHFPKPNLHQEKVMVTVWWSAAGLIDYSFLNPSETITSENYAQQINEMHQKLQGLPPALVNRKGSVLLHNNAQLHITQPMLQKLNELGYKVFPHPPYSPDLSPTDYSSFKHLTTVCRENASTTSRRQKMLSKSSWNHKAWIFTLQE